MKILLADDHALIRSGLRNELAALDDSPSFVEAWDYASLRDMLDRHRDLDLALVDLTMPGMQGVASIAAVRADFPTVPLIVVSGVDAPAQVQAVLRTGAAGYIPKSALSQVMLQAIRLVLAGGQYLPPEVMLDADPAPEAMPASRSAARAAAPAPLALLSPRQREVFELLAQGLSNKMIARQLDISEGTVKSHVATIFDVLNVHNRVAAVAEARALALGSAGRLQPAD
jgi:DNA-binding NarL/FixJ family response regulator